MEARMVAEFELIFVLVRTYAQMAHHLVTWDGRQLWYVFLCDKWINATVLTSLLPWRS